MQLVIVTVYKFLTLFNFDQMFGSLAQRSEQQRTVARLICSPPKFFSNMFPQIRTTSTRPRLPTPGTPQRLTHDQPRGVPHYPPGPRRRRNSRISAQQVEANMPSKATTTIKSSSPYRCLPTPSSRTCNSMESSGTWGRIARTGVTNSYWSSPVMQAPPTRRRIMLCGNR